MGCARAFLGSTLRGTDHASPYTYDTHVPLLFTGCRFSWEPTVPTPNRSIWRLHSLLFWASRTHACGGTSPYRSGGARSPRRKHKPPGRPLSQDDQTLERIEARRLGGNGRTRKMTPAVPNRGAPDLSVNVAGLPLKNPVIAASEHSATVSSSRHRAPGSARGLRRKGPVARTDDRESARLDSMRRPPACSMRGLAKYRRARLRRRETSQAEEIKNIVVFANVFGYTREDYERTIQILNEGE